MFKYNFTIILVIPVIIFISCVTTVPKDYTQMTYSEFVKLNNRNEALGDLAFGFNKDYKIISDLYIINNRRISNGLYSLTFKEAVTGDVFNAFFDEDITGRFQSDIIYKVFYIIPYNNSSYTGRYELNRIVVDKIEGLMSIEEFTARLTAEENEKNQREEIARQERLALIEEEFGRIIASRNPVTIMDYLRSNNITSLSATDRSAITQRGQLEVAKILTGNNNVRLSSFWNTWERYWGHSGRTTPFNAGAFEEGVVYTGPIIPNQYMDGLIYSQISDTPESSVLYRNVSAQDIRENADRWLVIGIPDALMVYEGQTQVRLTNGRTIRVPLFNVLYYRK